MPCSTGASNLIDTSIDYGRSEELNRPLRRSHAVDEVLPRVEVRLPTSVRLPDATPPFSHDYRPENIRAGIERSLLRLGTDRLDLLQVHMSPSRAQMETDDTVATMQTLQLERARCASSGCRGYSPTSPIISQWGSSTSSRSPTRVVQREHEELITAAAEAGAGTLIRGGAAARRAGR